MFRNNLLLLIAIIGFQFNLQAQNSFRTNASGKTIVFKEIDGLNIQGSDANELILEREGNHDDNERARGLRVITGSGAQDNTGLSLSVKEEGNTIIVEQVGRNGGEVNVTVPNSAIVEVTQSTHHGGGMEVRDFSGDLDVSMMYHKVVLENVTGPTAVNSVYASIEARLDRAPTNELHLHSTYSNVDLAIPGNTSADLRLSTSYGDMYTDFDILISANSGGSEGRLNGTINGGGTVISLVATYNDVYLRKQ